MSEYRINIRFNLSDTEHLKIIDYLNLKIIDYLNSLDKEKYKSRNQFIIDAVKTVIANADKHTADNELLNKFREVLKEELCGISVAASAPSPSSESFNMELTEDEKQKNDAGAIAFLEMF